MDTTVTKIKLVFWPTLEYRQIQLEFRRRTRDIVTKALQDDYLTVKLNLHVSVDGDPQSMGEEEYDARIEYSLKITGEATNELLLLMIHFFVRFLGEQANDDLVCAVQLPHNEFFKAEFCSANTQLPTCSFAFLNLIDRLHPFVHGSFKIAQDPHKIMDRVYNQTIDKPTLSDFEHDRRQLVVRFPFFETQRRQNREIEEADYLVSMTVRYKTIRRVLAKIKPDDQGINLELYFHLSSPPVIKRVKLVESKEPINLLSKFGDRYTSWDRKNRDLHAAINDSPIFRIELQLPGIENYCQLLNRLSMATDRGMEFRTFSDDFNLPIKQYVQSPLSNKHCAEELCKNNFKLMYMIAALLSRGAVVKDYLMTMESERDKFIKRVAEDFERDNTIALEVLEQTLTEVDKRLDCLNPALIYDWIHTRISRSAETMHQIQNEYVRDGYVRVRKVLITPTRMLFVAPELLMGNRVLRKDPENYPLDKFLRVVFRDDDGSQVHATNVGTKLIDIFVGDKLRQPIEVAGRRFNYFGSSNSQMRDNGCYFINASLGEIEDLRKKLGSFKIQSAPKMMSRIAQCFTQARETGIVLDRKYYATTHDFLGGRDSKEDPYNFSDGVGKISLQTARELGRELKLDGCIPSCFQIRFRGFKGVLSVDRALDDMREWGKRYEVVDKTNHAKRDCWLDLKIMFRPSQKKFRTEREGQKLEIVKYSSPVPISLNRPVNNILDQVSAIQSQASHRRICDRIHLLMDLHLHSLTRSLVDEVKAKNKLGEFPKLILYDQITGLNLTKEPFFRSLVRASVQASLRRLRTKLQIPIPSSMGRAMFGVADESGQLQYGQVYIQYTKNCSLKLPGYTAERKVLTGRVMITKNPSIVAGDIRMFEAVDIPALHHLCDVVVFPRYGPRPHTDEMAGSDLDGDEYTVIWDEQLYLDRNEEAFDYTSKATEAPAIDEKDLRDKMASFFVDYIKQDSIGRIANAFLVNSDLYGIASEVCQRIAAKHMEAVDFPKTGVPPQSLSTKWEEEKLPTAEEPGREAIPPERAERSPDYMEKNNEPMYISSRLNGQLYRRALEIDDILTSASQEEESAKVECDPLIDWSDCTDPATLGMAKQHYDAYAANIQNILDTYGIKTEGELFSGHFTSLRNRLSDKDSDDMSFYNTTNAIEQQLFSVFGRFRRQFFETAFKGSAQRYEDVTTPLYRSARINGVKDVFKRICSEPTDDYKKLACAYYRISYDSTVRRLLSFPWLAWDVINVVRRTNAVGAQPGAQFSFDPLADRISAHMNEYISRRRIHYRQFMKIIDKPSLAPDDEQGGYKSMRRYCHKYNGLGELAFFAMKWAKLNGLIANGGALCELHISLLLVQVGLNHLSCQTIESSPNWLEMIDPADDGAPQSDSAVINLECQHGGLGRKLFLFFEYLASRQFQLLPFVDFTEANLGYASVLQPAQIQHIHKAALQTYHQIAFSYRFGFLPGTKSQREHNMVRTGMPSECDPFIIEVPVSRQAEMVHNHALLSKLCDRTQCTNIVFRDLPLHRGYSTARIYVSATGALQALKSLRDLLSVRAPPNLIGDCRQIFTQMAEQLFDRLISL